MIPQTWSSMPGVGAGGTVGTVAATGTVAFPRTFVSNQFSENYNDQKRQKASDNPVGHTELPRFLRGWNVRIFSKKHKEKEKEDHQ